MSMDSYGPPNIRIIQLERADFQFIKFPIIHEGKETMEYRENYILLLPIPFIIIGKPKPKNENRLNIPSF